MGQSEEKEIARFQVLNPGEAQLRATPKVRVDKVDRLASPGFGCDLLYLKFGVA